MQAPSLACSMRPQSARRFANLQIDSKNPVPKLPAHAVDKCHQLFFANIVFAALGTKYQFMQHNDTQPTVGGIFKKCHDFLRGLWRDNF